MTPEEKKKKSLIQQWLEQPTGQAAIAENETDDAIIDKVEARQAAGEDVSPADIAAAEEARKILTA